ncbi:glycoside hydrolase family 31 protein [Halorarius litoreus]|uniref:glycoside hydrolase family 31 protein n=1 Tax=Halorarius litoreus TaxID=2962676 RepID=UPI0020CC553D|nr:TIM-barrel domain-containing protein [Halorarius litoreus]
MTLRAYHRPDARPVAADAATVVGDDYRVTVLAPELLRVEFDPDGAFDDRATQTVWYRDQPVPEFSVDRGDEVVVDTGALELRYDPTDRGFTPETLAVEVRATATTWRYGETTALPGTARTLDTIDGRIDLERGLCSRDGLAVLDDTASLAFGDEWVEPRDRHDDYEDLYLFGYGHDYRGALQGISAIAGDTPLVPRFALGNWWSRYWEYTDESLRRTIDGFREHGVPLSVCVVDMDWHVVDNPNHDGWTGFTWNEALFPDPEATLDWLHEQGLATTLNLHPAQGVHPHEARYAALAEHVGVDPTTEVPIGFDAADTDFLSGYFEEVLHPLEEQGVDFWWVDWQQWRESPRMEGLDPLWALNHLHAFDRTRDGRRPFLLSRYSGVGSHRYPVGFSGDTASTWDSLAFQPPFTAAAATVGYGWWSHDIGGHWGASGSPEAFGELYARWVQYGLYSPVLRLHTSKMPYVDKRPWRYGRDVEAAATDALRHRHALLPYLYTMAHRAHESSVPLVEPLYVHQPEREEAYACPSAYYVGSDLLVAPHTRPRGEDTNLARQSVWLPPGDWYDFHTGEPVAGNRWHARYGDLDDVPVYLPAGAIVPLAPESDWGGVTVPDVLDLVVIPGEGVFDLYEDDGVSLDHRDGAFATTPIETTLDEDDETFTVRVGAATGDRSLVPDARDVSVLVRGVTETVVAASDREVESEYDQDSRTLRVDFGTLPTDESVELTVTADGPLRASREPVVERVRDLLWHFDAHGDAKPTVERLAIDDDLAWLTDFATVLSDAQIRALVETVHGVGADRLVDADADRLVLWNHDGRDDVTYRFSTWDRGIRHPTHGTSRSGVVPAFETIDLADYESRAWELVVTYGDVSVTVAES